MPVASPIVLPFRIVTAVWPPARTPTLSSCGSGQVWGPIPGPVRAWPPRSTVTLSTSMTMPSPWHVMSFASVKLSLTRIAQRPSREGKVAAGDGETLPPGDGLVAPAGLGAGGAGGAGVEAAWAGSAAGG